jgi:hypothetical protein
MITSLKSLKYQMFIEEDLDSIIKETDNIIININSLILLKWEFYIP